MIYFLLCSFFLFSQVAVVTESFSASTPSVGSTPWTTDVSSWNLSGTTSPRSGSNDATIGSGVATNKYFYIPITIKQNYVYSINFWTKNLVGIKVVVNETADLVTPIYTYTLADASAGGSTGWKNIICNDFLASAATTSGYVMVCLTSATNGGSTGAIDDFSIIEENANTRVSNFYINDGTVNGNDLFTTAVGNDANSGKSKSLPKRTLTSMINTYSGKFISGDTIFVDAGTYSDVGINITIDGLKIIGAGNKYTIFSSNNASGYFMNILANNVLLKNLLVQNYGYSSGGLGLAQAITIGNSTTTYTGIVLYDVQIDKNGGSSGGMAVHILANTTSTITAGGATCNNSNQTYSGGVNVIGNNINLLISNYVFSNNGGDCFGGTAGGALKITGGNSTQKVEIRNTTFNKNEYCSSTFNAMDIYMTTGDLKVYDSKFNNSSSSYASGTAVGGSIGITGGNVLISGSMFTNHRSTGGMQGCAIGNAGGTVTLQTCYFSGNNANKADDVHNSSGSITATDCTWNEIGQTGGTFTISNSGNPTVFEGSIVKTNTISAATFINPVTPVVTGTCGLSFTILPIELTRFDGDCNNGDVILTWQTASEKNNKEFNVERSMDGINFEVIGTVKGAGNSERYSNYSFIDDEKLDVLSYYRLSQIDYNGKLSHSKIISVEHSCGVNTDPEILIYPNPTLNNTVMSLKLMKQSSVNIEVYNGIGQLVKLTSNQIYGPGLQELNLEISEFPTGVYFIKTTVDDKEYIKKIIKL